MKPSSIIATLVTLVVGAPLVWASLSAFAHGEQRRSETALRALFGDTGFEALTSGVETQTHYLGNDLLAPNFELKDQDGKPWRLKDQRGKVVILNFWTITCQPCIEEMPSLQNLARILHRNSSVELVSVSTDQGWSQVSALFPRDNPLRVLFDPDKKVVRDLFGTRMYPETWVIDAKGVVRMRYDGSRDWSDALTLDIIETFL